MSEVNDDFRIFKRTYRDRQTSELVKTDDWYIQFRDHLRVQHRWPAFASERQSRKLAEKLMELVGARRSGEPLTDKQTAFLETIPDELRDRLVAAGIIDRQSVLRGGPLLAHLEGQKGEEGKLITPGYQQALQAKGGTPQHVKSTIDRVKRIIDGCAFSTYADFRRPGAITDVGVFLGGLREKKKINGSSYNYYIRCLRAFCRWMVKDGRIPANPFAALERVSNADVDKDERRELSVDEVRWLLDTTLATNVIRLGLRAEQRERLYRFSFQTGMRPGQIRGLTKASFDFDADPPIVTARAATVKRRKIHTQVLTPEMATELKGIFSTMMPAALAFKMPSACNLARMLRKDMADAREKWIEAGATAEEKIKRGQSDFLADVDHQGAHADYYSLRHSHGSALADAGVPQKDIQASLHHTTSRTTERYLHTRRHSLATAIGQLPIVKPVRERDAIAATGMDSAALPAAPPSQPMATYGNPKGEMKAASSSQKANTARWAGAIGQTENPCVAGSIPALPISIIHVPPLRRAGRVQFLIGASPVQCALMSVPPVMRLPMRRGAGEEGVGLVFLDVQPVHVRLKRLRIL
jgi:integrase